jgi:hypothetical protein
MHGIKNVFVGGPGKKTFMYFSSDAGKVLSSLMIKK